MMSPSVRSIIEFNIKHYRNLLETESDTGKRQTIEKLLAEEEQKLSELLNNRAG